MRGRAELSVCYLAISGNFPSHEGSVCHRSHDIVNRVLPGASFLLRSERLRAPLGAPLFDRLAGGKLRATPEQCGGQFLAGNDRLAVICIRPQRKPSSTVAS